MTQEYQQLNLFPETLEEKFIRRVKGVEEKLDRQRKGQFAKIGALQKSYNELKERFDILEAGICKNNLQTNQSCEIVEISAI